MRSFKYWWKGTSRITCWTVRICTITVLLTAGMTLAYAQTDVTQSNEIDSSLDANNIKQTVTLNIYATMEGAMVASSCGQCTLNELVTVVARDHAVSRTSSSIHLFALGIYAHGLISIDDSIDVGIMSGMVMPFAGSWQPIPLRIPIKALAKIDIVEGLAIMPEAGILLVGDRAADGFVASGDVALAFHFLQIIDVRLGLIYGNHFGLYGGIGVSLINIHP